MKKVVVIVGTVLTVSFLIFGLVVPKILESRVPEMEKFLNDQGYKNPKVVDVSGWQYQVTFKTDKGLAKVRAIKGGGFAIKY
jgi:hypothetical protein